jgi:hypothetical protein
MANGAAAARVQVRRSDCGRRRRRDVVTAIANAVSHAEVGNKGDAGTVDRLARAIKAGLRGRATHVCVGRGDFSVNVRFAKGSLVYATATSGASSKAPLFRVLVFDSLSLGTGIEGAKQLEFQAMRDEHDEPEAAAASAKKKNAAKVMSDVEGVPSAILNSALKVLNDSSIDGEGDDRASALREELTRKFGSFWCVVSDEADFSVACESTALPIQDDEHGRKKNIHMRFKRGAFVYDVWHHVAPFDRYGLNQMTWAEKARYARYALLLTIGLCMVWYRYSCVSGDIHGLRALTCSALPKISPIAIGFFIFLVVSAHVDTRAWIHAQRKED